VERSKVQTVIDEKFLKWGEPGGRKQIARWGPKGQGEIDDSTSPTLFPKGNLIGDEKRKTGRPEDMMRSVSLKFTY
jgi:hypothetical protein